MFEDMYKTLQISEQETHIAYIPADLLQLFTSKHMKINENVDVSAHHINNLMLHIRAKESFCTRGIVGWWAGGTCPPSFRNSGHFRKFQNFISTADVRGDVMRFECKRLSEKYHIVPSIESLPKKPLFCARREIYMCKYVGQTLIAIYTSQNKLYRLAF